MGCQSVWSIGPGVHQHHWRVISFFVSCHDRGSVGHSGRVSHMCTVIDWWCVLLGQWSQRSVGQWWDHFVIIATRTSHCDGQCGPDQCGIQSHVCPQCGRRCVLLGLQYRRTVRERICQQHGCVGSPIITRVEWCAVHHDGVLSHLCPQRCG